MKNFKKILAVVLTVLMVVPFSCFMSFADEECAWTAVGAQSSVSVDGDDIVITGNNEVGGAIAAYASGAVALDDSAITIQPLGCDVDDDGDEEFAATYTFAWTTSPSYHLPEAGLGMSAGNYSFAGIYGGEASNGLEYGLFLGLSDVSYYDSYLGVSDAKDNTAYTLSYVVVSNGSAWGWGAVALANPVDLTGEITVEPWNFYNEDDQAFALGAVINGDNDNPVYFTGYSGAFDGANDTYSDGSDGAIFYPMVGCTTADALGSTDYTAGGIKIIGGASYGTDESAGYAIKKTTLNQTVYNAVAASDGVVSVVGVDTISDVVPNAKEDLDVYGIDLLALDGHFFNASQENMQTAFTTGGTIDLYADLDDAYGYTASGVNVTLNLNGHKLYKSSSSSRTIFTLKEGANVTVNADGATIAVNRTKNTAASAIKVTDSTFTLNDATVYSANSKTACGEDPAITATNSTITLNNVDVASLNTTDATYSAALSFTDCTVNMTGKVAAVDPSDQLDMSVSDVTLDGDEYVVTAHTHTFDTENLLTLDATCVEDGYTYYECTKEGCTGIQIVETIPATGSHTWDGDYVTDVEATCTTPGHKFKTCVVCNFVKEKTIDALGHKWGDWTVVSEATTSTAGLKYRICQVCEEREDVATYVGISAVTANWDILHQNKLSGDALSSFSGNTTYDDFYYVAEAQADEGIVSARGNNWAYGGDFTLFPQTQYTAKNTTKVDGTTAVFQACPGAAGTKSTAASTYSIVMTNKDERLTSLSTTYAGYTLWSGSIAPLSNFRLGDGTALTLGHLATGYSFGGVLAGENTLQISISDYFGPNNSTFNTSGLVETFNDNIADYAFVTVLSGGNYWTTKIIDIDALDLTGEISLGFVNTGDKLAFVLNGKEYEITGCAAAFATDDYGYKFSIRAYGDEWSELGVYGTSDFNLISMDGKAASIYQGVEDPVKMTITAEGNTITIANAQKKGTVKDAYIFAGTWANFEDAFAARKSIYCYHTTTKIAEGNFSLANLASGDYTVFVRFEDADTVSEVVTAVAPAEAELEFTSTAITGFDDTVKAVRIAEGEYTSAKDVKANSVVNALATYTVEGTYTFKKNITPLVGDYTAAITYADGTTELKALHFDAPVVPAKTVPTFTATAITGIDDTIQSIRIAEGEYATAKDVKANSIANALQSYVVDGTYTFKKNVAPLAGAYTAAITYTDGTTSVVALNF